jgi:hypothetical protein
MLFIMQILNSYNNIKIAKSGSLYVRDECML